MATPTTTLVEVIIMTKNPTNMMFTYDRETNVEKFFELMLESAQAVILDRPDGWRLSYCRDGQVGSTEYTIVDVNNMRTALLLHGGKTLTIRIRPPPVVEEREHRNQEILDARLREEIHTDIQREAHKKWVEAGKPVEPMKIDLSTECYETERK